MYITSLVIYLDSSYNSQISLEGINENLRKSCFKRLVVKLNYFLLDSLPLVDLVYFGGQCQI